MRVDWKGIVPALSTPTDENGILDEYSMRSEVRWNIDKGAHMLAVSLVAGEFYKFTDAERMKTFEIAVDEADGEVPVLASVSHSGTEVAAYLAEYAKHIGADGVIAVPPYFNETKASLSLYEHYATIASRVDLPIMIQDRENIGPYMSPTLWAKLAEDFSNIVSVKIEGRGTFGKVLETRHILGDELVIFGGMAARDMLRELPVGVSGNIPDACLTDVLVDVYESFVAGNVRAAEDIFNNRYIPWLNFLRSSGFDSQEIEKETLRLRGVIKSCHTRFPKGRSLDEEAKVELKRILQDINLI